MGRAATVYGSRDNRAGNAATHTPTKLSTLAYDTVGVHSHINKIEQNFRLIYAIIILFLSGKYNLPQINIIINTKGYHLSL